MFGWIFRRKKSSSAALIPNYVKLWAEAKFNDSYLTETVLTANKILINKARYEDVEQKTGVPWYLIAAIHYREASNNFKAVLHNGERIVGTGKKTKLVPANRGPFNTWEEAAVDALKMEKLPTEWTVEACLEFSERFNGLGYRSKGVYSPYVWAGTNIYTTGMYVADGKFSSSKKDPRIGVACIIKKLIS